MSFYYTLADKVALDENMALDIEYLDFLEEILGHPESNKIPHSHDKHFDYIQTTSMCATRLHNCTKRLVIMYNRSNMHTRDRWFFTWFSIDRYITMFRDVIQKLYQLLDKYTAEEDAGQYYCICGMIQTLSKQLTITEPVFKEQSKFLNFYMLKKSAWSHAERVFQQNATDVTLNTDNPIVKVPLLANNIMRRAFEYV